MKHILRSVCMLAALAATGAEFRAVCQNGGWD